MGLLSTAAVLLALCTAVCGQCSGYSQRECLDCAHSDTLGGCHRGGVPQRGYDVCTQRGRCLQCVWSGGVCAEVGTPAPMTYTDKMLAMQMVFYQGKRVTLLFDWWETESYAAYLMSLVIIVAFSAKITVLRFVDMTGAFEHIRPLQALAFFLIESGLYMMMLVTMTYNAGCFLATVVGVTLGYCYVSDKVCSRRAEYKDLD
eukprot:TRINITY_DN36139_c0_g1_i1.p1 TRINITY_DN36139_c0_g1~~TRINITY_DN36139_c0_g1_i1.p1  ORF type:complete len:228 (+),score=76.22 TRINITY_DN36139_c0_g1_i1:81-686(+)